MGVQDVPPVELPAARPEPVIEPAPAPAAETLVVPTPVSAVAPVAEPAPAPAAAVEVLPVPETLPPAGVAPAPAPVREDVPRVAIGPGAAASAPAGVMPTSPATPPAVNPRGRFGTDTLVPERSGHYISTLTPELQREVDQIAARQDEEMRRNPQGPAPGPEVSPDLPTLPSNPASTRLEISRAPSPTEARPIRAIPVPEEFVPLPKREWDANRKLWSAAATCHLPLYFQDASLERYGYSVEQHFGRLGRFLSVPIDDPRQSKQRNQIVQPFFSMGLFAAQIVLLPYNMIMDPPWESEYDLGYYRPGDRVPTDTFYLPLTGIGPPLRGSNYAIPPGSSNGALLPPSRW